MLRPDSTPLVGIWKGRFGWRWAGGIELLRGEQCPEGGDRACSLRLEHVMNLSRELDVVRREARSKQSGWDLALEDARRTAGRWSLILS